MLGAIQTVEVRAVSDGGADKYLVTHQSGKQSQWLIQLGQDNRIAVLAVLPTSVDPATGNLHQMYFGAVSSDAELLYDYAVAGLNDFPLAYLMLTEPRVGALSVAPEADRSHVKPLRNTRFRDIDRGMLIGAGGFTPRTAEAAVADKAYDLIAFGRWFLANPDLPDRLRTGAPLNVYDRNTFYGVGPEGYTDYPDSRYLGDSLSRKYPLIDQSRIGSSLKAAGVRTTSPA